VRNHRTSWAFGLSLACLLWACADDPGNATEVQLSVKTDLALTTELSAVRVRVYRASDSVARSAPVSEFTLDVAQLTRGLPLVIEKKKDADFLLAVQALGPGGVTDPQIERQVRVRFQDGKSVVQHLFLARACLKKACTAVEGQTCYGEMRGATCEGTCAPIDGPDLLNEARNDDPNWRPTSCNGGGALPDSGLPTPSVDGSTVDGARGDGGPSVGSDGGLCTPSIPAASCNTVDQCGCPAGKSCGVVSVMGTKVQLGCIAPGTVAAGGDCSAKGVFCVAGSECVGSICRPFCDGNADCEGGRCVPTTAGADATPIDGLNTCFDECTGNSECDTNCCAELPSQPGGSKVCLHPRACCVDPTSCTKSSDCCGGTEGNSVCVSEESGGAVCHSTCTSNDQCNSGCCAKLESGLNACFAASVCAAAPPDAGGPPALPDAGVACRTENQTCTRNTDCCGGPLNTAVCVEQEESVGPICANRCTSNAQCGSGCCAGLQGGGSVCAPVVYCQ
jgi:hypothetical protein